MQSSTPHEIVVGLIVFFLGLAIVKGYGWLIGLINSWDDRWALRDLREMEKDPALYADKMVRRQRMMFGIGGYLACADLFVSQMEWLGMKPLKVVLGAAAGVCALVGGTSGSTSTEMGVREVCKIRRERLKKRGKMPAEIRHS